MIIYIIVLIVLIFINGYFAASEIAFISLSEVKIENEAKKGKKEAIQILEMIKKPSNFLSVIQIGITFAGFLSSAFASDVFSVILAPFLYKIMPFISLSIWKSISIIFVTLILSYFTLVLGELVPKRIALKYPEKIAYKNIKVISFIANKFSFLVKFLSWSTSIISKVFKADKVNEEVISEEEIKLLINKSFKDGKIEEDEKDFINNVFLLNDTTAGDIMTYLEEVKCYEINESIKDILKKKVKFSRVPVYEKNKENIKGIFYLKDLISVYENIDQINLKDIIKPIYKTKTSEKIDVLFHRMQKDKIHIAIVEDENKKIVGILTLEDIIEKLLGKIYDEHDNVS